MPDEETAGDELTNEQSVLLRGAAVDVINVYLCADKAGGEYEARRAEFALKVLDFVTG